MAAPDANAESNGAVDRPLSVVVPCVNEEETVGDLLERVLASELVGQVILIEPVGRSARWRSEHGEDQGAGGCEYPAACSAREMPGENAAQDRVREMIHRFNDLGMRSLDPQWAGGRPRQITTTDRALIVKTATTRPAKLDRPFTDSSIRKLAGELATKGGRKVRIGQERLRQILIAEGITFQRTKTWKESPDPLKEQKSARIEYLLEHARDRTFAFDEFGPLTIRPVDDTAWAPKSTNRSVDVPWPAPISSRRSPRCGATRSTIQSR